MLATDKYFKAKPGTPIRLVSTRFGRIDFRSLTPAAAWELLQRGCDFIELTPEGRVKYLNEKPAPPQTAKDIATAIEGAENMEQADELLQLKPESVTVQKAYEKRKSEI